MFICTLKSTQRLYFVPKPKRKVMEYFCNNQIYLMLFCIIFQKPHCKCFYGICVMSDFRARLEKFARERYDFGQNKFEAYCNIPRGTISKIRGGSGISTSTLTKICARCPELNVAWLLTGDGDMLNRKEQPSIAPESHTLPLIPWEAFAGPGLPAYEDERIEDFYTVSEFMNSDFLIRVKGDSMTPKYSGGDLVACKKVSETYFLQWGRVYVIYTRSQGIMIKRVQPSEDMDYIKCVSDNPRYAPFDVPKEDIVSIALVNGAITLD